MLDSAATWNHSALPLSIDSVRDHETSTSDPRDEHDHPLSPRPHLGDKGTELRVERRDVHSANSRPHALATATAPAGSTGLAERRDRDIAGHAKAARQELGANRQAIVNGQKRKSRPAVTGAVLHHRGAEIAPGEPPRRSQIGDAVMYIGLRHREIGKRAGEAEHARGRWQDLPQAEIA